jgi:hypothetical protein
MRRTAGLWALVICTAAPSGAAAQTVYFSAGREIRQIDAGGAAPAVVHTGRAAIGDLALCAGNPADPGDADVQYLYFVEHDAAAGDRIGRVDVNTRPRKKKHVNRSARTVLTLDAGSGRIGEIRLTPDCDVMFATAAGVFRVSGTAVSATEAAPVERADGTDITTGAGSGLAVALDGSLRYSDAAAVRSTLDGFAPTAAPDSIVGLGVANAGAGSAVPAVAALSPGTVCASTSNAIRCGPKPGGPLDATLAVFEVAGSEAVNRAQFFEFLTDDTAFVATSVDPDGGVAGEAGFNGILWKVDGGGVVELARGPKVGDIWEPIVGVAVSASDSRPVPVATAPGVTHYLNFGPVAFDVRTPVACDLAISLRQLSWAQARVKLDSVNRPLGSDKYGLDPALGGESWADDVEVRIASGTCDLSATPATIGIAQFVDNGPNRAVLHCDGNAWGNECAVATEGNFPYSTPDDERDSALPDNFSDFLTATIARPTEAPLMGLLFSSPLSMDAVVTGPIDAGEIAAATRHSTSAGIPIKFRICANPECTEFAPAETPDPPAIGAGLSITRLSDAGVPLADCEVDDQGGANPDRPVFRVSEGGLHQFNLNTPPGGPAACTLEDLAPGRGALFVATVFSHGGLFRKTSVLFWLGK